MGQELDRDGARASRPQSLSSAAVSGAGGEMPAVTIVRDSQYCERFRPHGWGASVFLE